MGDAEWKRGFLLMNVVEVRGIKSGSDWVGLVREEDILIDVQRFGEHMLNWRNNVLKERRRRNFRCLP